MICASFRIIYRPTIDAESFDILKKNVANISKSSKILQTIFHMCVTELLIPKYLILKYLQEIIESSSRQNYKKNVQMQV